MATYTKSGEDSSDLIPGLTDDLALICIARVPFFEHQHLALVCKGWRDLVFHRRLLHVREDLKLQTDWLFVYAGRNSTYALRMEAFDPLQMPPQTIPALFSEHRSPPRLLWGCHVVAIGYSIYVVGGSSGFESSDTHGNVWKFDVFGRTWQRRTPMKVPRVNFACAAIGGKILAAGGWGVNHTPLDSVEMYDPDADSWRDLPDMHRRRGSCVGVALDDDRFLVLSGIDKRVNERTTTTMTLICGEILSLSRLDQSSSHSNHGEAAVAQTAVVPCTGNLSFGDGMGGQLEVSEFRAFPTSKYRGAVTFAINSNHSRGARAEGPTRSLIAPTTPTVNPWRVQEQGSSSSSRGAGHLWRRVENMWRQVSLPGALVVLDGRLLGVSDIAGALLQYDWDENSWTVVRNMPYPQKGFQLIGLNGGLLLVGVFGGHWLKAQEYLDGRKYVPPSWDGLSPLYNDILGCVTIKL